MATNVFRIICRLTKKAKRTKKRKESNIYRPDFLFCSQRLYAHEIYNAVATVMPKDQQFPGRCRRFGLYSAHFWIRSSLIRPSTGFGPLLESDLPDRPSF